MQPVPNSRRQATPVTAMLAERGADLHWEVDVWHRSRFGGYGASQGGSGSLVPVRIRPPAEDTVVTESVLTPDGTGVHLSCTPVAIELVRHAVPVTLLHSSPPYGGPRWDDGVPPP